MTVPSAARQAPADLISMVYEELRLLAKAYVRRERRGSSLQPTALVHEAYLVLAGQRRRVWRGKTHFKAIAARQMRRVLVDHARARQAGKRGGSWQRVSLEEGSAIAPSATVDVLALDEALDRLARLSERQCFIVESRIFGGLTQKEIAALLKLSERTVRNEWVVARTWLARELESR